MPLPYTKKHYHLRKSGSGRNSSPQGRAHCVVVLSQMVGFENIPTSNIIWAQKAVFRNTYVYKIHTYVQQQLMMKEPIDLKESGGVCGKFMREGQERRTGIKL